MVLLPVTNPMEKEPNRISSSFVPQSSYRKKDSKTLTTLQTTIPALGVSSPHQSLIEPRIDAILMAIHMIVFNKETPLSTLKKDILAKLFQDPATCESETLDGIWNIVESPIINHAKVYYLTKYIHQLLITFESKVLFLVNKYKRHLPNHISNSEGDDLLSIAQLELIEAFKSWKPNKNTDLWPLAYTRINGAMKDHIRYISKSDPSRFYDWVVDAAQLYMAINQTSQESFIESSAELERALKYLDDNEQKVTTLYLNQDYTFAKIATEIGLSESHVSRIYKTALKKIKDILH